MTDEQAARIAALRARRDGTAPTAAPTGTPIGRRSPRRSHVAARSRAFALGASLAGTAAMVSSMWSGAAAAATAATPEASASPATGTLVVRDPASPQQTVVIRIVRRPSAAAATVRSDQASTVVAAPAPATVAPQPATPQPAPVTRSRRSG